MHFVLLSLHCRRCKILSSFFQLDSLSLSKTACFWFSYIDKEISMSLKCTANINSFDRDCIRIDSIADVNVNEALILVYVSLFQFMPPRSFVYTSVTLSLHSTYAPIFIFARDVFDSHNQTRNTTILPRRFFHLCLNTSSRIDK